MIVLGAAWSDAMSQHIEFLIDGSAKTPVNVVLAHGAGAGMDSPFMAFFAEGLAAAGFRVVRFEFPYMAQRRQTGKQRPPDREPVLRDTWLAVIKQFGSENLIIGGKSMGGRIASLVADEAGVEGVVCLGYPFHPSGKPDRLRVEHLLELKTPTLIVQGERDAFGSKGEVAAYTLSKAIQVRWLPDGDHSFKPRKASGRTEQENREVGMAAVVKFTRSLVEQHASGCQRSLAGADHLDVVPSVLLRNCTAILPTRRCTNVVRRCNAGRFNEKRTCDFLSQVLLTFRVPEVGVEPTRPYGHRILSPARLPFRHSGMRRW
jgi:predicted alpha/beta-hydrolase family hydrolase